MVATNKSLARSTTLFGMYPFLKKLFADGGYQGPEFHTALTKSCLSSKLKSSSAPIGPKDFGGASPPLGCRTHYRLAQPLPKACQGLGEPQSQRAGIFDSHRSASCSVNFVIPPDVFGQTLSLGLSLRLSLHLLKLLGLLISSGAATPCDDASQRCHGLAPFRSLLMRLDRSLEVFIDHFG